MKKRHTCNTVMKKKKFGTTINNTAILLLLLLLVVAPFSCLSSSSSLSLSSVVEEEDVRHHHRRLLRHDSNNHDEEEEEEDGSSRRKRRRRRTTKSYQLSDYTVVSLQHQEEVGVLLPLSQVEEAHHHHETSAPSSSLTSTNNVAKFMPATQSCNREEENGKLEYGAHLAVDGSNDRNVQCRTVSCTCQGVDEGDSDNGSDGDGNWWMVDLRRVHTIDSVNVFSGSSSTRNFVSDFFVEVLMDEEEQKTVVSSRYYPDEVRTMVTISFADAAHDDNTDKVVAPVNNGEEEVVRGRYIRIRLNKPGRPLILAEVEVLAPTTPTPGSIPKLRRDWTSSNYATTRQKLSPPAQLIHDHQNDCSIPAVSFDTRPMAGLGSDIIIWGRRFCNAYDENSRFVMNRPWLWLDEKSCGSSDEGQSAMTCYFPSSEQNCDPKEIVTRPVNGNPGGPLSSKWIYGHTAFEPAVLEFLFSDVSSLVVKEAERQLPLVFPDGIVPKNLITLHVRWGDKTHNNHDDGGEMQHVPMTQYIESVKELATKRGLLNDEDVHVFLATYEPEAVRQWYELSPPAWKTYHDPFLSEMNGNDRCQRTKGESYVYAEHARQVSKTKGRAGLVTLGSLLLALEADDYVLTTASNWSKLIDELRKIFLNDREECGGDNDGNGNGGCTRRIDLSIRK